MMRPFSFVHKKKPYKTPRISRLYLKLRSKFAISFFLLILIPFVAFIFSAYIQSKTALEKNTFEMNVRNINQTEVSVKSFLGELDTVIQAVVSDPDIKNLAKVNHLLGAYIIRNGNMLAIYEKSKEHAAISSPSSQAWFTGAVNNPSGTFILGTNQRFYEEGRSEAVFSAAKAVEGTIDGMSPTVLLFDFDYTVFADIVNPPNMGGSTGEERILINGENNVIYCKDPGSLTIPPDSELLNHIGSSEQGFKRINYNGESRYLTYVKFPGLSWTFISMLPAKSVLNRLMPDSNPFIAVCIILAPLILLLYFIVSSVLLNPINELTAVISGYEKGHLIDDPDLTGLDREQLSAGSLNNTSEIDYLINKVYTIRLKQKEAELNSLQNQINPHFLYNTLESIRGAALYHGIHDIAAMSKALSLLFRYSISDKVLVTIREEVQHLENYMSIQNFRYENKFELIYSIPTELYNYKILKLTLQPLIENSIKHGLEMKLGRGTIKIEILSLDNNIKMEISDDGLGIPPKKVEDLNRRLARDEQINTDNDSSDRTSTGIGVRNVNSRIKLYFGEQYGLKFREASIGTVVEITLPVVKES